jgi:hypothetical protein
VSELTKNIKKYSKSTTPKALRKLQKPLFFLSKSPPVGGKSQFHAAKFAVFREKWEAAEKFWLVNWLLCIFFAAGKWGIHQFRFFFFFENHVKLSDFDSQPAAARTSRSNPRM